MSRKNNGSMKQIGSSHRGRRGKIKDNPNPETSDGEKTSILSMNIYRHRQSAACEQVRKPTKKADLARRMECARQPAATFHRDAQP